MLQQPYGDRGGVPIEPMLTDQWYVRVAPMAKTAIEAVEDGRIQFVPKQYENMYFSWMRDIQDWCVSRQLWWVTASRPGMTTPAMSTWAVTRQKCVPSTASRP